MCVCVCFFFNFTYTFAIYWKMEYKSNEELESTRYSSYDEMGLSKKIESNDLSVNSTTVDIWLLLLPSPLTLLSLLHLHACISASPYFPQDGYQAGGRAGVREGGNGSGGFGTVLTREGSIQGL